MFSINLASTAESNSMLWKRVAGLIVVCAVILSVQLLSFGISQKRSEGVIHESSSFLGVSKKSSVKKLNDDDEFFFAPIIIGAGHGTTGTHLFVEVTCHLGFVSLHYGIGCLPANTISVKHKYSDTTTSNATSHQNTTSNATSHQNQTEQETCPKPIDHFRDPYPVLFGYHTSLCRLYVNKAGSADVDPLSFRKEILQHLERIILWGKDHKVALALHDSPYPLLMPEILKLVQKHYGSSGEQHLLAKPIILLSERDPSEYVEKRIHDHGDYSICQPTPDQLGTNTSSKHIAIETMNATTLEGGAFDMIGCIKHATFEGRNETQMQAVPQLNQILYSMEKANRFHQRQFIIDNMKHYQDVVKGSAIFSYNMFEKENRTDTADLVAQMKQSMVEALVKADGHQLRMKDGLDFLGFPDFFGSIQISDVKERIINHRRRRHGESYNEETRNDARTATLDDLMTSNGITNYTKMVPVHIFKKLLMCDA